MWPDATSIAPCQMTRVMAVNIMAMTMAVMNARRAIRFLAVEKTVSVAAVKRWASRSCWLKAWTIFIAPNTSLVTAPTSAMRSWLRVEMARTRRPMKTIGRTISGMPSSIIPASLGAR